MSKKSPTSRTTDALKAAGWTVQIVEKWNPFAKVRQDLFGGIDILAIRQGETLGVQATSKSNVSARVKKLHAEPRMKTWCEAGNLLEVWGWDGPDLRVVEIKLKDDWSF